MTEVSAIAVVIPAHNEGATIGACISSVLRSARAVDLPVSVHVILDACDDGSAAVCAGFPVDVVEIDARSVGSARETGCAAGLLAHEHDPRGIWFAHTDADSTVPRNWLRSQLDAARGGADVYVGTVRPDLRHLGAARRAAWIATHPPGPPNGHVHGANLGMRASVHLDAGGFPPVLEHEDVGLVAAARALGASVVARGDACVRTSGRLVGRTPGGYARYLRDDLIPLAADLTGA